MKTLTKTEVFDTTSESEMSGSIDGIADLGDGTFLLINSTDSTNGDTTIAAQVSINVK